eukprot:CAMPEP_0115189474 /NCGR_PEP_ID=MMETSP0270-20121206/11534_1 /TAXON_ID=71861 /ORGANISM="Scrippsiella trochoidea, Strain CCMP3099" /LENGTH=408 /DNA_ID=CAMNT_0002602667 /DNA_START=56 /DNA_END=1282 /DNA_ORIENTATION=+
MASIGGAQRVFRLLRALRRHLGRGDDAEANGKRSWERIIDVVGSSGEFLFRFFPPRRLHHFITCTDAMGEGGFGVVCLGKPTQLGLQRMPLLEEGRVYAVKRTDHRKLGSSKSSVENLSTERILEYVGAMRDPAAADAYIIRCFAFMLEVPRGLYYEVMELLEGPDLHTFLAMRKRTLPEATAAGCARQIFTALNYIHRRAGILHRDVKPENFGFERPLCASADDGGAMELPALRLFDFGLAWALPKVVDDSSAHDIFAAPFAGTPLYLAPEGWQGHCGPGTDVWGAGLIVYLMLSLDMPFCLLKSCGKFERALDKNSLEFPSDRWDGTSADARALVSASLERDPRWRCSAAEALANGWLSSTRARAQVAVHIGAPAITWQAATEPILERSGDNGTSNAWCLPAGTSV